VKLSRKRPDFEKTKPAPRRRDSNIIFAPVPYSELLNNLGGKTRWQRSLSRIPVRILIGIPVGKAADFT
jgi:hypothetical protein